MSEMIYGQIMAHSNNPADIGETITFTDETGNSLTGTIGNDGYCRKKLPAFKSYTVIFGSLQVSPIALGCGENYYLEVGTISKTLMLYSAVGDTVHFTDIYGDTQVVVLDNDSDHKQISLDVKVSGSDITFTSAVAKNPEDLTEYYSKTITLDANTSDIYVMPDHTLYWYGHKDDDFIVLTQAAGYTSNYGTFSTPEPTFNTNQMTIAPSGYQSSGVGTKQTKHVNKVHGVMSMFRTNIGWPYIGVNPTKAFNTGTMASIGLYTGSDTSLRHWVYEPASAVDGYVFAVDVSENQMYIDQLWYE